MSNITNQNGLFLSFHLTFRVSGLKRVHFCRVLIDVSFSIVEVLVIEFSVSSFVPAGIINNVALRVPMLVELEVIVGNAHKPCRVHAGWRGRLKANVGPSVQSA